MDKEIRNHNIYFSWYHQNLIMNKYKCISTFNWNMYNIYILKNILN